MEFLQGLLANGQQLIQGIVGGSMGVIVIFAVSTMVRGFVRNKDFFQGPQQFMLDQGYQHATALRKTIKPLLDEAALKDMVAYADDLPNFYDAGWDAGLLGKEKPSIEDIQKKAGPLTS